MSARFKLVTDHAGADDWYDTYGTAMNLAFDICEVLDAADVAGDITPALFARWVYNRGAAARVPSLDTLASEEGDSYGAQSLAQALLDGAITTDDLIYVGDVMHRYTGLLIAAGRDY